MGFQWLIDIILSLVALVVVCAVLLIIGFFAIGFLASSLGVPFDGLFNLIIMIAIFTFICIVGAGARKMAGFDIFGSK